MSISLAPKKAALLHSATLLSKKLSARGKPPPTTARCMGRSLSREVSTDAKTGYTQSAATLGKSGTAAGKSTTFEQNCSISSVLSLVYKLDNSIQAKIPSQISSLACSWAKRLGE